MVKTRDVEAKLGIKSATLRKYALALEGQGYEFERDANGRRLYSDADVVALEQFYTLQKHNGMNVETAAKVVATRYSAATDASESVEIVPAAPATDTAMERYGLSGETLQALQAIIAPILESNRNLAAQNAALHKRMDDQNAHIAAILRETTETRRMIAAQHAKKPWQIWKKDMVLPDLDDPEVVMKLQGKKI